MRLFLIAPLALLLLIGAPPAFFTTSTFNSATGANSPVDGEVSRTVVPESFATIRAGAGNANDETAVSLSAYLGAGNSSNYETLTRSILCFDTSSLTAAASISSAKLTIVSEATPIDLGDTTIDVVSATPASNANLANSDYGNLGTTSFGQKTISTFTIGMPDDINFNASGIAAINKTAVTCFGVRIGWDVTGVYGGVFSSNAFTGIQFVSADGGGDKPVLSVTYTLFGHKSDGFFACCNLTANFPALSGRRKS